MEINVRPKSKVPLTSGSYGFLGEDRTLTAGVFKQKVSTLAAEEVEIELLTRKDGQKVTGYEMTIREPHHFSPIVQEEIPFDFGDEYK